MNCADLLDFAGYAGPVEGLGPGRRLVCWVRGCRRRCPGCIAQELWEPGEPTPVTEIAERLRPLLPGVDGLTISGGEPFEQPRAMAALLDLLRRQQDIETLVYTGYTYEELLSGGREFSPLLERIDLLIDEAFIESLPNTLQWRGSDNQRVLLLTERAQRYADMKDLPMPDQRPLQVQMLGSQRFRIIGIPRRGDLPRYRALLSERGVEVRAEYDQ